MFVCYWYVLVLTFSFVTILHTYIFVYHFYNKKAIIILGETESCYLYNQTSFSARHGAYQLENISTYSEKERLHLLSLINKP